MASHRSQIAAPEHPPGMRGLQLSVALPAEARRGRARFEHHPEMPVWQCGDARVTVIAGQFGEARSPALVHTPLVGAEVVFAAAARQHLPLDPRFEYGMVAMSGAAAVAGTRLEPGSLLYLGVGRDELTVDAPDETRRACSPDRNGAPSARRRLQAAVSAEMPGEKP
jgi:redox-sensitive bicupin YhaK (pirin superfamily)